MASTVQQLAELHEAHRRDATWAQRFADRVTGALGQPGALVTALVLMIFWMIGTYAPQRAGVAALEQAPFSELGLILTVVALLVALLILTTQRHEQALAEKRSQSTLQIAILSERKIAKLIGMLDDLRIALPSVPSHRDLEAEEMAISADPIATMELIEAQAQAQDQTVLRDCFIRVLCSSDLHQTTSAMDDVGQRLSKYFLFQLVVNISFGINGAWLLDYRRSVTSHVGMNASSE